MPLYEYRCAKCGNVFEKLQKMSDAPLKRHPDCGGKVEKLISASGLHFKGSGFYITDYAKSGSGAPKTESTSSESKSSESKSSDSKGSEATRSESKSETKSEVKSEAKSESKKESKPDSKLSAK